MTKRTKCRIYKNRVYGRRKLERKWEEEGLWRRLERKWLAYGLWQNLAPFQSEILERLDTMICFVVDKRQSGGDWRDGFMDVWMEWMEWVAV